MQQTEPAGETLRDGAPSRRVGRPRSPELQERILRTTLRHLAESGYSRMSIEAIAAEAGVSKPTIYRRWSGKADLATAALTLLRVAEPPPESGPPSETLRRLLENFRRSLLRPNGMALIGTVLAEESQTPELLALFRRRLVEPRRRILRSFLLRARREGAIRTGADIDAAVNMLVGSFYARYLSGKPIGSRWSDRVARTLWIGLGGR